MLKYGALIILAVLLAAAAPIPQTARPQPSILTAAEQSHAPNTNPISDNGIPASDLRGGPTPAFDVEVRPTPNGNPVTVTETNQKRSEASEDCGLIIPTWLLAAFTGGLLAYTARLWGATSQLARESRSATDAQLRAYVTVPMLNWGAIKDATGVVSGWVFMPSWENSGNTPTREMKTHVDYDLTINVLLPNYSFADRTADITGALIGPRSKITGGSPCVFTIAEMQEVAAGTKHLYIWGWARYRDTSSESPVHVTRYCFKVIAAGDFTNEKGPSMTFTFHDRGNCADGECVTQGLG